MDRVHPGEAGRPPAHLPATRRRRGARELIPRSILAPGSRLDLDLRLRHGTWPDGLAGEVFVSASDVDSAPRHAFFGDGWMQRLSLRPGSHGAGADRWAAAVPAALVTFDRDGLSERSSHTFDAAEVGAGPVAGLEAPGGETVPFLLHSAGAPGAAPADPGIDRLHGLDETPVRAVRHCAAADGGKP